MQSVAMSCPGYAAQSKGLDGERSLTPISIILSLPSSLYNKILFSFELLFQIEEANTTFVRAIIPKVFKR